MRASDTWFRASDGAELFVRKWQPPEDASVRAVLQIHHGLAEHSERYARFAEAAVHEGFAVVCHDARGHGKTAEKATPPGLGCAELGDAGVLLLVDDFKELISASRKEHPGAPVLLFGHSNGSFIAQITAGEGSGVHVQGVVLSAPPARLSSIEIVGLGALISAVKGLQGEHAFSSIPDKLTFQKYQANLLKRIKAKGVSGFEWLSRDEAEVAKYVADPHCGQLMSNGWWKGMVAVLRAVNTHAAVPPASVPVMVVQGESDTCGMTDFGTYTYAQIHKLFSTAPRGVPPKTVIYPGARHELLNETCRDEVTRDVLDFFASCVAPRSRL